MKNQITPAMIKNAQAIVKKYGGKKVLTARQWTDFYRAKYLLDDVRFSKVFNGLNNLAKY